MFDLISLFVPYPDSKVYGANMGPSWDLSASDGPHVGPMNLAIRVGSSYQYTIIASSNVLAPSMPQATTRTSYDMAQHVYMHHWAINSSPTTQQNGRHFTDDTFFNENVKVSIKIHCILVFNGPVDNIAALVQIMAWRWPGGKPLSVPMMVRLPTHICVTRPQWVKKSPYVCLISKSWN